MTMFILYDGRARSGDPDEAAILTTADNIDDARCQSAHFRDYDAVWFEYKRAGTVLHGGRMRLDIGQFLLTSSLPVAGGKVASSL